MFQYHAQRMTLTVVSTLLLSICNGKDRQPYKP